MECVAQRANTASAHERAFSAQGGSTIISTRSAARFGLVLRVTGVPALALLGAGAAAFIPTAHADLVPTLPTVTLPSLPISLPTAPTPPVGTTGTTTTAGPGITSTSTVGAATGAVGQDGGSEGGDDAVAAIAGAIHLASGAVSVPVSSVRAPAFLVLDRITTSPSWIAARGQRFRVVVRVGDSRGFRVRGASIGVGSAPGGRIKPAGVHKTGLDGTVTLQLTTSSRLPLRKGSKLILVVSAYEAGSAPGALESIRRVISLPVRPR
jgi:hypothetical protein